MMLNQSSYRIIRISFRFAITLHFFLFACHQHRLLHADDTPAAVAEDQPEDVEVDAPGEPIEFDRVIEQHICAVADQSGSLAATNLTSVAFSKDGRWLAVGDSSGNVFLGSRTASDKSMRYVSRISAAVRQLSFSYDHKLLFMLGIDGGLLVRPIQSADQPSAPMTDTQVLSFAFDADRLLTLNRDQQLQVWLLRGASELKLQAAESVKLDEPYVAISTSHDQRKLLLYAQDRWQIRDLPSFRKRVQATLPAGALTAAELNKQGSQFATGLDNGTVRIRDIQTGQLLAAWKRHPNAVTSLAFSSSGDTLLSGCLKDRFRVWDIQHGKPVNDRAVEITAIHAMALSPNDDTLAMVGKGNRLCLLRTRHAKPALPAVKSLATWNHRAALSAKFLDRGTCLAVLSKLGTPQMIDLSTDEITPGFAVQSNTGHESKAAISYDGSQSAYLDADGAVRVYDSETGKLLHEWTISRGAQAIATAPGSSRIAIAGKGLPATLRIVDLISGETELEQRLTTHLIRIVRWDPDGESLLTLGIESTQTGRRFMVSRWSAETGELIKMSPLQEGNQSNLSVSPDGSRVAVESGASGFVEIFDRQLNSLNRFGAGGIGGMHAMRFLDARRLIVGTYKGSVVMMDTESGQEQVRFEPFPPEFAMPVRSIDYAPESNHLVAAGGKDGHQCILVYDLGQLPAFLETAVTRN